MTLLDILYGLLIVVVAFACSGFFVWLRWQYDQMMREMDDVEQEHQRDHPELL